MWVAIITRFVIPLYPLIMPGPSLYFFYRFSHPHITPIINYHSSPNQVFILLMCKISSKLSSAACNSVNSRNLQYLLGPQLQTTVCLTHSKFYRQLHLPTVPSYPEFLLVPFHSVCSKAQRVQTTRLLPVT